MMTKVQRLVVGFIGGSIIFTVGFWLMDIPDPHLVAMCIGGILGIMAYNE